MVKSVLVTGAHGFLGRHVARRFADAGCVVTGIGHGNWDREEFKRFGLTFWHTADIGLDELVTYAGEPDAIVHCAGSGSVPFSMSHPHQDFVRTVSATAAVLEYVRLHSPRTAVVYPSSVAVYGTAERLPIREGDALHPASPYGVHKYMAENLCRGYAYHFNVAVAIVRFFSIYGEGLQKQLLWDACNKAAGGDPIFFGTGSELRDWLHVEDAASLLQAATPHASPSCPVVNGASGEGVPVRDVLAEIFHGLGGTLAPKFNGKSRLGDPKGYHADITAAKKWGWHPAIQWRDGMKRYVDWYQGRLR
jgi:UDP-glucose 4-epimerase